MKRLIALAALLCAASACATTTDNANTTANANANANANATATATPAGVSQADIEAKEHQVWDAIKAKNWDAFSGMLTDDFVIVADDGVQTKAQMMDVIKKYDLTEYTFSDVKFLKVDADLAVLTYTSTEKSSYDGHPSDGKPKRASSAWVNRGGKWLAAYHQESEVAPMPQQPGGANANANAAANTNANSNANASSANANSNASSGTEAAEADNPIDKEKKVWEELKSKNYDAFASDLADDAVEVEPEGVYNKAASINGVKMFDASKYAQSDFKETKLDADASLVTYVVKSSDGKDTEYHSTIWSKRGQKWYAVLHQGTRAMKM